MQHVWIGRAGGCPTIRAVHQCVLAYASDFTLLDTALIAHGKLLFDKDMQLASLDHALWFHRPFRADEWLLYVQDSPQATARAASAAAASSPATASLVASVAQEGLMRQRHIGFRAQLMGKLPSIAQLLGS